MVYDGILEGRYVDLKSCSVEDAEFTLALRQDPVLGKYFPKVNNTLEQQIRWIRAQRLKDGDYFFVVWNKTGERIGTIGIYGIEDRHGEGGRIIIKTGNPFDVFEAQLLLNGFAFHTLDLDYITGFVYAENKRSVRFNSFVCGKMLPPEMNEEGVLIIPLITNKDDFNVIEKRIKKIIY